MAAPESLRAFQGRLASRLAEARQAPLLQSWLAVEAGDCRVLVPMQQIGAIFPVESIRALPHVQPWFMGVTNLRGGLHGVVDLAAFLGLRRRAPQGRRQSRLVALHAGLNAMCALHVDQVLGMRRLDSLRRADAQPDASARPDWAGEIWHDAAGEPWHALDLQRLSRDPRFLRIDDLAAA